MPEMSDMWPPAGYTSTPTEIVDAALERGLVPMRAGMRNGQMVPWRGYTWWRQLPEPEQVGLLRRTGRALVRWLW